MLEPLNGGMKEMPNLEFFEPDVVEAHSRGLQEFGRKYGFPPRHYNQLAFEFNIDTVRELLEGLSVDPEGKTVTIFGGYTGQFADVLRKVGFSVVFTDPIGKYVTDAEEEGLESYQLYVENLPSEIIKRSDLFSTFECYQPFSRCDIVMVHTILRLLSSPGGILFAESEGTRREMEEEAGKKLGRLKSTFGPFADTYSVTRKYREANGLRLYRFYHEDEWMRKKMVADCQVLRLLDIGCAGDRIELDEKLLEDLSEKAEVPKEALARTIKRLLNVRQKLVPKPMRKYYADFLHFPTKSFKVKL